VVDSCRRRVPASADGKASFLTKLTRPACRAIRSTVDESTPSWTIQSRVNHWGAPWPSIETNPCLLLGTPFVTPGLINFDSACCLSRFLTFPSHDLCQPTVHRWPHWRACPLASNVSPAHSPDRRRPLFVVIRPLYRRNSQQRRDCHRADHCSVPAE
jgi:hypothetical protein